MSPSVDLLISQYFLETASSSWDLLCLADKVVGSHPDLDSSVFIGKVQRYLHLVQDSPDSKKATRNKACLIVNQWDKKLQETLRSKFKGKSRSTTDIPQVPTKGNICINAKTVKGSTFIGGNYVHSNPNVSSDLGNPKVGDKRKAADMSDAEQSFWNPKDNGQSSSALNPMVKFMRENSNEDNDAIHEKDHVLILQEGKTYRIHCPGNLMDSPHKPKIQRADLNSIADYVIMAGSGIKCIKPEVQAMYTENQNDQMKNRSLNSLPGVMDFVKTTLQLPFDDFPRLLWSLNTDVPSEHSAMMMKIIQYTMTSFHLHCMQENQETDHERTYFVDLIIPAFRALGKVTGLVKYHWCEKQLLANKLLYFQLDGTSCNRSNQRFMDGLGCTSNSHGNMESVLMEASSGNSSEHTQHTLGDTIKLLECSTNSLRVQAASYKCASFNTFKNLKVNTVQCVKDVITLHQVSIYDAAQWQSVEKRSCQVPNNWNQRVLWTKYFELIATLMITLSESKELMTVLDNESAGLTEFDGVSVKKALSL